MQAFGLLPLQAKQCNGWSLSIFIEPRAYLLQLFQSSMTRLIREEIYALAVYTMIFKVYFGS